MTMTQPDDPFIEWCWDKGIVLPEAQQIAFADYVLETTGFDGQQFSLSEDERAWITRANEIIEWLRLAQQDPRALDAAYRCLNSLKPIPSSLTIE